MYVALLASVVAFAGGMVSERVRNERGFEAGVWPLFGTCILLTLIIGSLS